MVLSLRRRLVPAARGLEQIGRKPLNVTPLGAVFFILGFEEQTENRLKGVE